MSEEWIPIFFGPAAGIVLLLAGLLAIRQRPLKFSLVGMGSLATVIGSVLDHARTNFEKPWLWLPTAVGVFATIVAVGLGALEQPRRADILVFTAAMLLMIAVGVVGLALHVNANLTTHGAIVGERFLRGAPFMAPLLFANMGTLGLIALLDPVEKTKR